MRCPFGAAFNARDSRLPFIETVARDEPFDALHFLADEARTPTGRDLTALATGRPYSTSGKERSSVHADDGALPATELHEAAGGAVDRDPLGVIVAARPRHRGVQR